jgi:hypothetical protein
LLNGSATTALLVETLHSGWEAVWASAVGFDAWGFDRESGDPVPLTGSLDRSPGTVSTRDILMTRGLDVPATLCRR